jgi:single-stranded DNA-binding protein
MVVYTYRRTKSTGEKSRIPTFLKCEAWHTGAETLEKFALKGTKITVNASAKNISKDNNNIIFRINEFDFCQQEYEE